MRSCPSCGGIIGLDCFNPVECAEITYGLNCYDAVDDYRNEQARLQLDAYYKDQQKQYDDYISEQYADYLISETMQFNPILNRFLLVV